MIILDIGFHPGIVSAFRDMVEEASRAGAVQPVVKPRLPEDDEELDEFWRESLLEQLRADCDELLEQLGSFGEGSHQLAMTPEQAEALLRASSAVRLKIRELHLSDIPDESLEEGFCNLESLPLDTRRNYMCYAFLASLQATLIAELDQRA